MPGYDDDDDMETVDGLKMTTAPVDRVVEVEVAVEGEIRPSERKPGTMEVTLSAIERITRSGDKKDALQFDRAVGALEKTITGQRVIILFLVIVLAMMVAGIVGVGVSGEIPLVGEIEIVAP